MTTPWASDLFADQGLLAEAKRKGYSNEIYQKGVVSDWARMKFASEHNENNWQVHPHGDLNLIQRINGEVSTNVSETWNVAEMKTMDQLIQFPFIFMHAESPPKLSNIERQNLKEYLQRGGFLYAEDCVRGYNSYPTRSANQRDWFFRRMKAELMLIAEQTEQAVFKLIPLDHPVFSCYYNLPAGQPYMQGNRSHIGAHGLFIKNRLVAYLSAFDAHCGWTNEQWFGRRKSQEAVKIGTNVYLYAMTHA